MCWYTFKGDSIILYLRPSFLPAFALRAAREFLANVFVYNGYVHDRLLKKKKQQHETEKSDTQRYHEIHALNSDKAIIRYIFHPIGLHNGVQCQSLHASLN